MSLTMLPTKKAMETSLPGLFTRCSNPGDSCEYKELFLCKQLFEHFRWNYDPVFRTLTAQAFALGKAKAFASKEVSYSVQNWVFKPSNLTPFVPWSLNGFWPSTFKLKLEGGWEDRCIFISWRQRVPIPISSVFSAKGLIWIFHFSDSPCASPSINPG